MSPKRMTTIMAGALCAVMFAPSFSAERPLYDTKRVLEHLGNEPDGFRSAGPAANDG